MALKIEGYRLGINDSTKVVFSQNADEFVTTPGGGSWKAGNISQGLQELSVGVPEELLAGKCQIIIDYNGQKSLPFTVEVLQLPSIPRISPRFISKTSGESFPIYKKLLKLPNSKDFPANSLF